MQESIQPLHIALWAQDPSPDKHDEGSQRSLRASRTLPKPVYSIVQAERVSVREVTFSVVAEPEEGEVIVVSV